MSTIFMRSAFIARGFPVEPTTHSVIIDAPGAEPRIRTWEDVHRERRQRQEKILFAKRGGYEPRLHAWRLSVAYYDQALFGGWQCMLHRLTESVWVDRDRDWLKPILMSVFPTSSCDGWEGWKPAFAEAYRRGTRDGRPRGVCYVRYDDDAPGTLELWTEEGKRQKPRARSVCDPS